MELTIMTKLNEIKTLDDFEEYIIGAEYREDYSYSERESFMNDLQKQIDFLNSIGEFESWQTTFTDEDGNDGIDLYRIIPDKAEADGTVQLGQSWVPKPLVQEIWKLFEDDIQKIAHIKIGWYEKGVVCIKNYVDEIYEFVVANPERFNADIKQYSYEDFE